MLSVEIKYNNIIFFQKKLQIFNQEQISQIYFIQVVINFDFIKTGLLISLQSFFKL